MVTTLTRKLSSREQAILGEIHADGRIGADKPDHCLPLPMGCGQPITPIVPRVSGEWSYPWHSPPEGKGRAFRDLISLREWQCTGLCQVCQDALPLTDDQAEFATLEAFYNAEPDYRRRDSPEHDYGVHWHVDTDGLGQTFRLTWIEATHEIVLVDIEVARPGTSRVVVLGRTADPDHVLEGWASECGQPYSVAWVIERVVARATEIRRSSWVS